MMKKVLTMAVCSLLLMTGCKGKGQQAQDKDNAKTDQASPWIMGQDAGDFSASDIEVGEVDKQNGTPVTLNLHNMGSVTKVRVIVVMDKGEWKVDNLIDLTNDFDWKQSMKEYLKK